VNVEGGVHGFLVDSPEDNVGWLVPASAFPPPLDDTPVVSINLEVAARRMGCKEGVNEELEPDCFCPPDVSAISLPTR
jgi:hypothetical protein